MYSVHCIFGLSKVSSTSFIITLHSQTLERIQFQYFTAIVIQMSVLGPEDASLWSEYVTKYWSSLREIGPCHVYCDFPQCVFVYIMLLSFELTGSYHIGVSSVSRLWFRRMPRHFPFQE